MWKKRKKNGPINIGTSENYWKLIQCSDDKLESTNGSFSTCSNFYIKRDQEYFFKDVTNFSSCFQSFCRLSFKLIAVFKACVQSFISTQIRNKNYYFYQTGWFQKPVHGLDWRTHELLWMCALSNHVPVLYRIICKCLPFLRKCLVQKIYVAIPGRRSALFQAEWIWMAGLNAVFLGIGTPWAEITLLILIGLLQLIQSIPLHLTHKLLVLLFLSLNY